MRDIKPIAQLGANRLPEMGRIRMGVKTARAMKSISTWRLTSPNRQAIEQLALIYGGRAVEWNDPKANPKKQWQVITTSDELRIWLPPDPLTQWYETWDGGGCTRRCDGEVCTIPGSGGPSPEPREVPCVCAAEGHRTCRPYTRIRVILPEVRFGGVWRLETKGWNAAEELPAITALIASLMERGLTEGILSTTQRAAKGGSQEFVVPMISTDYTAIELSEGAARVGQLGTGLSPAVAALERGTMEAIGAAPADMEAIEAELVDDEPEDPYDIDPAGQAVVDAVVVETTIGLPPRPSERADPDKRRVRLLLMAEEVFEGRPYLSAQSGATAEDFRHALCWRASQHRTQSSTELSIEEMERVITVLADVQQGLADIHSMVRAGEGWIVNVVKL